LIVGRVLERQEILQKGFGLWRPDAAAITAAGGRLKAFASVEEVGSKLVESGTTHPKMGGCGRSVERPRVEVVEDAADESDWLAVD
jgi:hypothetical protein